MQISNLSFSYNEHTIFQDISVIFPKNGKIGIVGANGAGKTTLFQLMLGKLKPDHGKIFMDASFISYLPQALDDDFFPLDETVFNFLLSGRPIERYQQKLQEIYQQLSENHDSKLEKILLKKASKYEQILDYYDQYHAEEELLRIVEGMQIPLDLFDLSLRQLSGGQKSKIAFARLLYSKSEILFLDEPTNHLDIHSVDFIRSYLKHYEGNVFIISHDIPFLNEVCNYTFFIDKENYHCKLYAGNYDRFVKLFQQEQEEIKRDCVAYQKEEEKLKKIVLLYSNSSGKRKRMAQSREKALLKLQEQKVAPPKKKKKMAFTLENPENKVKLPLRVEKISFGYPKNYLFRNLSFSLETNERLFIQGENGVGKSTLLKLLVGEITPTSGSIFYDSKVKIGYFAQEHDSLNPDLSIIEQFADTSLSEEEIRDLLGKFLFSNDDVFQIVKHLSFGERSRVLLAKLMASKPNLLILDEVTNHLDPDSVQKIAQIFHDFHGAMIVVSHNSSFIKAIGFDKVLSLPDGKVRLY